MLQGLLGVLNRARLWASRNETIVRWLGLSRSESTPEDGGLILIQIDGLSRTQLERALKRKRMPFLRKLIRKKHYQITTMYSGLPSSTPAVQAELFYGAKCAVPAFSYRDADSGQIVRMFENGAARRVQERVSKQNPGLFRGGSVYSNIYSGEAREAHFCAVTLGWSEVARAINPLVLLGILCWHSWSVLRIFTLVVVEIFLALADFVRGQLAGRSLAKELRFVPSRVAVSVLLREIITIGASVDATRGLPVIQLNFLGYDEQAHRRGPSSAFAHWTLLGIDDAIKRVWTAARRSQRRRYRVWIYSDHGQERSIPYRKKFGRTVQEMIAEIFGQNVVGDAADQARPSGVQYARAQWLGRAGRRLTPPEDRGRVAVEEVTLAPDPRALDRPAVEVAAMGPIGHIYPDEPIDAGRLERLAQALVHEGGIPLVLAATDPHGARAWTKKGTFRLPEEAQDIFGADHPFVNQVGKDLVTLCHHPSAGVLVIGGWVAGSAPLSFAEENGAHAGPGLEETRAFVLTPPDAKIVAEDGVVRPLDLRNAVLRALRELSAQAAIPFPTPAREAAAGIAKREKAG